MRRHSKEMTLALLLAGASFGVLIGASAGCGASHAADGPLAPAAVTVTDGQAGPGGNPTVPAVVAAVAPPSNTVRIVLMVIPSKATARVLLGKKLLGVVEWHKPLVIVRPRDSGPLDILVRADGFLPVQTRLYTFADGKLNVKLTAPDNQKTLLGYREPPPAEVAPVAAGGAVLAPANELPAAPADAGAPP